MKNKTKISLYNWMDLGYLLVGIFLIGMAGSWLLAMGIASLAVYSKSESK